MAMNVKDMPLVQVVESFKDEHGWPHERLACGHSERQRQTTLGYFTTAKRRRCWQCLSERLIAACPAHQPETLRSCCHCGVWGG